MNLLKQLKMILADRFNDAWVRLLAWLSVPGGAVSQAAHAAVDGGAVHGDTLAVKALAVASEWGVVITFISGLILIVKLLTDIVISIRKEIRDSSSN